MTSLCSVDSRDAEFVPLTSIREDTRPSAANIPTPGGKKTAVTAAGHAPSAPATTGLWHAVKRSKSKESRQTQYLMDRTQGARSRQRPDQLSRPGGATSQGLDGDEGLFPFAGCNFVFDGYCLGCPVEIVIRKCQNGIVVFRKYSNHVALTCRTGSYWKL